MKRQFLQTMTILVFGLMGIMFTSCGGDDDNNGGNGASTSQGEEKNTPDGNVGIGSFTINDSGTKVAFAPGNLQATTTNGGATWTWAFAKNQWDYIGGRSYNGIEDQTGNNFINGNNGTLSTNSGTVDLFGWVGASTILTSEGAIHGICSYTNSEYNNIYGTSKTEGLKSDWGNVTITNGGGHTWRTLTSDEWTYIFNSRKGSTVEGTTKKRYTMTRINSDNDNGGLYGIILFPDGMTINIKSNGGYTTEQWTYLASLGCVFLPAAGSRYKNEVNNAGSEGRYWSSTPARTTSGADLCVAYNVLFHESYGLYISSIVDPAIEFGRMHGISVRLVREIK